jgi:pyruvate dehydrogenase E1 component alpha subunit
VSLTGSQRIETWRRILLIRRFEEAVIEQLRAGLIPGAVHTSIGHEASIVGACMALRDDDFVFGSHRSHGHPIAKGAELAPLMAELMGKRTGVCKGQGGSMHLADHSVGVMGESGIVGGGIPLATGAGLSARVRGSGQVTLCFFGDGASNEGSFHESLNMAAIWKLPVVYLCENNLYGATTPARLVLAVPDVADRAAAYAMPGEIVDGQDAFAVHEGVIIPGIYRDAEEVERWKQRDPLEICRRQLAEAGLLDQERATALEDEVAEQVARAVSFARNSELPDAAAAFEHVFVSPPPEAG